MGVKFVAIALMAMLSLQGLVEAKSFKINEDSIILDEFTKIVNEIKASVTKLIIEGIATVKTAMDRIQAIAQQELNKAMSKISALMEETLSEIKELEKKSEELGYDVQACVEEQMPRIQALVQQAQQGVSGCVADILGEFTQMYEDLLAATTASYDIIFALVGKFDECQDWECRGETAKELVQEMMRINSETRNIIDRAMRTMQDMLPQTVECMQGQITTLKGELNSIVNDIKACVEASQQ